MPDTAELVIESVFVALREAEDKHPGWPTDPIHAAAILGEEAGELLQAAIDFTYTKQPYGVALMEKEAAQCAAMGIRFLLGMMRYKRQPGEQRELKLKD